MKCKTSVCAPKKYHVLLQNCPSRLFHCRMGYLDVWMSVEAFRARRQECLLVFAFVSSVEYLHMAVSSVKYLHMALMAM